MRKEIRFYNHLYCNAPFSNWSWVFKENRWQVTRSDCLCETDSKSLSKLPLIVVVSPCYPIPFKDNTEYAWLGERRRRNIEYCWKRVRLEIERWPEKSFFVELYPNFVEYDNSEEKMRDIIGEHSNLSYFDTRETMKVKCNDIIYSFSQFDLMMKKLLNSSPLITSRNTLMDSILSIFRSYSLKNLKGIEVSL